MNSKEIKSKILKYEITDELLDEGIENNFKDTIVGIYGALFELLKYINNNHQLIDYLLNRIDNIIFDLDDILKLKNLEQNNKSLVSDIYKSFDSNQLESLYDVIVRLRKNTKNINRRKRQELENYKIKIIEEIICNSKDFKLVKKILKCNNLLELKDINGNDIIYRLLSIYNNLDVNDTDKIDYFNQVITLFVIEYSKYIEINSDYYLNALSNNDNYYIQDVINKIGNKNRFYLKELEGRYNINISYPVEIENELYTFKYKTNNFIDFTNQESLTIDKEDSKCLDDALYIEKNNNGTYTLYIHIAYVPALIPFNSSINKEAIKRIETMYLIDDVAFLYPEFYSNYQGSLLLNNARYCETGIVLLDNNFNVLDDTFKLVKSKIFSHHRLTYDDVDSIIDKNLNDNLTYILKLLGNFAIKQKSKNIQKEKYRKVENLINKDSNHESINSSSSISANIVQESMILFNELKAKYYKNNGLPYIYRCLDKLNSDIIVEDLLKKSCIDFENFDSKIIKNLKSNLIPAYTDAYYSTVPKKHYGLNKEVYSHSSSALRRYADSFGQYIDENLLFNSRVSDRDIYKWQELVCNMVDYLNNNSQNIENFAGQYNYLKSRKLIKN